MRKLTCALLALIASLMCYSQLAGNELQQPLRIATYTERKKNCEVLYISTTYSKFDYPVPGELNSLNNATILAIDLVYTDFPAGHSFNSLNRNRFLKLDTMLAGVNLKNIPVTLYRQTRAKTKHEAEKDFHGFVIYYKKNTARPMAAIDDLFINLPKDTVEIEDLSPKSILDSAAAQIYMTDDEFIKKLTDTDFNPDTLSKIKDAFLKIIDSVNTTYFSCYSKSLEDSFKSNKLLKVKVYTKEVMVENGQINKSDLKFYKNCEKFLHITGKVPVYSPLARFYTLDSVVEKVLTRNKWNNMMVCADVTGSMSPYVVQLLVWLKLNANNQSLKYFVAFNDGDNKQDKKKKIGKTGGIYSTPSWQYKDVAKTVYTGVKNGNGGDTPENDIEALLFGQDFCNNCSNFILIADNNAPVKDLALLHKMSKPVKVILCGVSIFINTDYLNIARKTGGSIHTIEADITHLALMKEGEIFEFKGRQYKIKGGSFVDITVIKTAL